jgi:hypothetical protein
MSEDMPCGLRLFFDPEERARLLHLGEMAEARREGELIGGIHVCQKVLGLPETPPAELAALPQTELAALLDNLFSQLSPRKEEKPA